MNDDAEGEGLTGAGGHWTAKSGAIAPPKVRATPEVEAISDEDDFVDAVFGEGTTEEKPEASNLRSTFAPWHHPVKQVVRDYQWADQCERLIKVDRAGNDRQTLRYFTLPGADLLDVRELATRLAAYGTQIEYFGFDSGYNPTEKAEQDRYLITESGLRQAGRITDNAEVLRDRLEDIAQSGSQAANRLKLQAPFDVINIDACDHLGYVPVGRSNSIFDALECLLKHQLLAEKPWLLFVTTRARPELLGVPAFKLQTAIHNNLAVHAEQFGTALAEIIETDLTNIVSEVNACWTTHGTKFLKLFCVGLGKYLLQYYHSQHNHQADVTLKSAFAYKVSEEEPDMLSLAFRIAPAGLQVLPATAGPTSSVQPLELAKALSIADKAKGLWDLDDAVANDAEVRDNAVTGTRRLLQEADYDLNAWKDWLSTLKVRPMSLSA